MTYDNYEYLRAKGARRAQEARLFALGLAPGMMEFEERMRPYHAFCDRMRQVCDQRRKQTDRRKPNYMHIIPWRTLTAIVVSALGLYLWFGMST